MMEHDIYYFYIIGYDNRKLGMRGIRYFTKCQLPEARDYLDDVDRGDEIYIWYYDDSELIEEVIPIALKYHLSFKIIHKHVIIEGVAPGIAV